MPSWRNGRLSPSSAWSIVDLLEALLVHQVELAALLVEELVLFLLEANALDRLGGAEALVQLGAVDQVLELDLLIGGALARLDVLGPGHHPDPILVLEHVARADLVAVDLHGSMITCDPYEPPGGGSHRVACLAQAPERAKPTCAPSSAYAAGSASRSRRTAAAAPSGSVHIPSPAATRSAPARASAAQSSTVVAPRPGTAARTARSTTAAARRPRPRRAGRRSPNAT